MKSKPIHRPGLSRCILLLLVLLPGLKHLQAQSYKQLVERYKAQRSADDDRLCFETGQQILKKYPKDIQKDPLLYAELAFVSGNYYFGQAQSDSAIYCYARAVNNEYSLKSDTSFEYAYYLYNLAYASAHAGYYEKAGQYYEASLPKLAAFLGASSETYTLFYKNYVEMKVDMGDYEAAIPMNEALVNYFKVMKGSSNTHYLSCLNTKARIAQGQGHYPEAAEVFLQVLHAKLQSDAADTVNLATLYNNTAECYRMMGDYRAAGPLYLEAYRLESAYPATPKTSLASLLSNMGLLYKAQSSYGKAENCFLQSIELYKAANYRENVEFANPLNNLGDLYRLTGNYKAAVSCIEQAIEIRRQTSGEKHEYYANSLSNLALLKMEFGYLEDAESLLLACESIYRERLGEDNQRYANCLSNLSALYAAKKDYSKALVYKERCLKLMEKKQATQTDKYALYLSGKGAIECSMKNYGAAADTYSKAAEIFRANFGSRNFDYIDMLFSLAGVYERAGHAETATGYYLRSMGAYRKIIRDNFISMSEEEKTGFYYQLAGRFETFYNFVIGQSRQPGFRNDSLMRTLLQVRLADKSLLLNESRALGSTILESGDSTTRRVFGEWIRQKRHLQELYRYSFGELAQNGIDLEREEAYKNTLEKQLSASSAAFRSGHEEEEASFAALKNKLGRNELAVEIIRTEVYDDDHRGQVNYAALLIGRNDKAPRLLPLDSCAFFDTLFISHYKQSIEDTILDRLSYGRFFKALEPYTKQASQLYFSADGVYQKLNLYTLYDQASGKYLLETSAISQLNSLKDLLRHEEKPAPSKKAALYGFPDYALNTPGDKGLTDPGLSPRAVFSDLPELPGTKQETETIQRLLRQAGWDARLCLGAQASEEAVKALKSPGILHIATHGFFLPDAHLQDAKTLGFSTDQARQNPLLRSGLLLAGASAQGLQGAVNGEDGILTAYEASLLDLAHTDLVVLSACETGLGDLVNGQGVFGLQRAFLTAGARSVMMSLWVVDDDATQELMTSFYTSYLQSGAGDKRSALRQAQLEVKKRYRHPYYWGAFVLAGP